MADDWKPGDLALCLRTGTYLRAGVCHTVVEVVAVDNWPEDRTGPSLRLAGIVHQENVGTTARGGFWHGNFIKVTPPEADEFDRETIALTTGKPARVKA